MRDQSCTSKVAARRSLRIVTAAGLLAGCVAQAVTYTWNTGSATWDNTTTGNWTPSAVPANADQALLTRLSAGTCDPRGFHVWADPGQTATATVSGTGILLANPGNESLFVGGTAGTSIFTQTGGTVNVNSAYGLGIRANGTYNYQGGSLLRYSA